jgi:D-3-phosphoglycerate dehydrogenase
MKVLIADKFEASGIDGLKQAGFEIAYEPDAKDESLLQAIQASGADVCALDDCKRCDARSRAFKFGCARRCWLQQY